MRGRRLEAVAVQDGADFFGGMVEVAGHFDFGVADGGDFGDGAGEVGLHHRAHGVELDADGTDLVIGGGGSTGGGIR